MADKLIVIAGPTACGKTQTAVETAKRINGEVVSADSMQVYRGMNIGTAKPSPAEMEGVPHHMIDVADPGESFSAARYQKMAAAAIMDIQARGRIPILTGGTGFYINAVVYGNAFVPQQDDTRLRASLLALAREKGNEYLHGLLREADPAAAGTIHPNNVKRTCRALAFCKTTGEKFSAHNESQRRNTAVYDTLFVLLKMERTALYERINQRVQRMFDAGLAEEVRGLLDKGYHKGLISMQGLGYKETIRYLQGEWTLEQAAEAIRTGTRHYAKRQITWFTHQVPDPRLLEMDASASGIAVKAAETIISWHNIGEYFHTDITGEANERGALHE